MKKTFFIVAVLLSILLFSLEMKATVTVYNYTGMQMNIRTSAGDFGVSASTGATVVPITIFGPYSWVRTYPGATGGGSGVGVVEWLTVGSPLLGLSNVATSSYTWASSIYGIIGYSVSIVCPPPLYNITIIYLNPA